MRIGIYGGTFNPVHNGHVHVMRCFAERLRLDKLLLIPTATPPHKQAQNLAPAEDRLAMCRLAARGLPGAEVSDLEIRRGGRSYTAETLHCLREVYPKAELFLLMGEDMFLTVESWYQPESIFALATIATAPRSHSLEKIRVQQRRLEEKFGGSILVEEIPYQEVSSTMIRERAESGQEIGSLVPPGVAAYIRRHSLYRREQGE